MNRKKLFARIAAASLIFACTLAAQSVAPQQSADELYQAALYKKEAEGDLNGAVQILQKIVGAFPENKAVAARATLQIGLCYEKLGSQRIDLAREAFQRVLDQYPGETDAVKVARDKLDLLARSTTSEGDRKEAIRHVFSIQGPYEYHQVSPDGRYVAYFDYGEMSVVVRELATGETRKLRSKVDESEGPGEPGWFFRWSPDGNAIACTWWRHEPLEWADLRILFLDGASPRRILQGDYEGVYLFSWSPDGRRVLAVFYNRNDRGGANGRMAIVSTDDGSVRFLKTEVKGFPRMAFSPDGRYIAYDSAPDAGSDNRDIFLVTTDGKVSVPLVTHPAHDSFLAWSPDGSRVLFTSDRLGTVDLWSVELAGGRRPKEPEVIRKGIGQIEPAGITRSGSLYYTTANIMEDIYVEEIDPETGRIVAPQERMILPKQGSNGQPRYSPDGRFLAYRRTSGAGAGSSLCVLSLETKEERVFPLDTVARLPIWSPDGRLIYFSAFLDRQAQMFRMDLVTGKYSALAPEAKEPFGNQFVGASPDGKSIYYLQSEKGVCRALVRDTEKGIDRELFRENCSLPWTASMSPDGTRMVTVGREEQRAIRILSANGNEAAKVLHRFEHKGGHPTWLAWTPDGRSVVFTKKNDAGWGLRRISTSGEDLQDLGISSKWITGFSFHPDGKHLVFSTRSAGGRDLWVMENFLSFR